MLNVDCSQLKLLKLLLLARYQSFVFARFHSNTTCLKPNSITLSGRRQVRSWSQSCSKLEFGLSS